MERFAKSALVWADVWALFIPLLVYCVAKKPQKELRPLFLYIIIALSFNSMATTMYAFHRDMPDWLKNNNVFYNLHSIARVLILGYFIHYNLSSFFGVKLQNLLFAYSLFIVINLSFFENPFFIGTNLFAAESIVLLIFTLSFLLKTLQDESDINWVGHPSFILSIGLGFYEAAAFLVYLFYYNLDTQFGKILFGFLNIAYIIFCGLLALSIYRSAHQIDLSNPREKRLA